ncbi:non-ribosomal peptide synthetase [Pseudoalteromonas umbrosa]|uniref:non-ribosomal peptide synthetase n=1 Tax=Pseudoalteromonas umbrosa TaxID=3048489 RepID=UPI0024C42717|nr:non-ribosomal peptide synthetase [Pseudoalteromonas sp. B95]MDK1288212.1 amino acid adenylation domain-containing protein [Pseudoalteromonas sp. B95]
MSLYFNSPEKVNLAPTWNLDGLIPDNQRDRISKEKSYRVEAPASITRTFESNIIENLSLYQDENQVSQNAIARLLWHKVLGVFGFTRQTVTLVNIEINEKTYWARDFFDHDKMVNTEFSDIISELHKTKPLTAIAELPYTSVLTVNSAAVDDFKLYAPLWADVYTDDNGHLTWTIHFDAALFDHSRIAAMLELLSVIADQFSANPNITESQLELISPCAKQELLAWNNTDGDYPSHKRLHHLIEEATERTPQKTAVVYKERSINYQQLNGKSNQIARFLLEQQNCSDPRQLVALIMDKDELLIMVILGIWKSGAAYVPIDPGFPDERIRFILADSGVRTILTSKPYVHRITALSEKSAKVVDIDDMFDCLTNTNHSQENFDLGLASTDPAYMTYTSGTTGVPKGVIKNNRSVINSITYLTEAYEIGQKHSEAIALFSPYGFEPFVRQLLIALINNQKLVIFDEKDKLDVVRFPKLLEQHGITYLNGTSSVLQQYDYSHCPALSRILLVGEELTPSRYKRMRNVFTKTLINEYAFTEAAFVTAIKFFEQDSVRDNRSIGRQIRNVKCYVLNEHLKQVPPGTLGELFIGGAGVANGYFNRPELTAERFIKNPHRSEHEIEQGLNENLYRTGDLARIGPHGELEFFGRNDFQIKLNGVRIEPGEIESITLKYPGVKACVVAVKSSKNRDNDEGKYLVGYYEADPEQVSEEQLINHLELQLPRFMVPARMVHIDSIPVNTNGKTDLKALPDIDALSVSHEPTAARNDIDQKLKAIWADTLGIPEVKVGISDNFFHLGGSSITAIILSAHIRKQFNVNLSIEDVFQSRTIEQLSDKITSYQATGTTDTREVANTGTFAGKEGSYLANSLQQGFMYQYLKKREQGNNDDYVMQSLFTYHAKISVEKFKLAWELVQDRYGVLRTRFEWKEQPLQTIKKQQKLEWQLLDYSTHENIDLAIKELQAVDSKNGYKLDVDNPFRVYLIKQSESCFSCLFSCHHIILDGWSLANLFNAFHNTYLSLVDDESVLSDQDTTYEQALSFWQENRNEHAEYWHKQIENITERGDYNGLVKQEKRYKVSLTEYDNVQSQKAGNLVLNKQKAEKIRTICSRNGITLHSMLQFVWHKVLHTVGNAEQTVVGTIVSGRNLPIDNIEHAVGLFINTLPLIVDHTTTQRKSALEAIGDIQSQVNAMNSFANVELGKVFKGDNKKGLFDTLFVLENYPDFGAESLQKHGIDFEANYELEKVDYPLATIVKETQDNSIIWTLWYAAELFEENTIDMLLGLIDLIFDQLINDITTPVGKFTLVDNKQSQLLDEINQTKTDFLVDETLHGRFETMVQQHPERIALVYEQTKLTYKQLNTLSNQIAHKLRSMMDIIPDKYVALVLDKNEHMFSSIFGVWKSGGAYVPIDPAFPKDRIQFILGDINAKLLITNQRHFQAMKNLVDKDTDILVIDEVCLDDMPHTNPSPISSATDLAYTMYTSGTTGNPKGVMIEHRGVLNLQMSLADRFNLHADHQEAFLSFSNYIFDHFVEQMTDALLNGQKLVVLNDDMRTDKARLYNYINENEVTYLSGTPSVLSMYEFDSLPSLTRIDAIGEDFTETLFNKIRSTFKGLIINGYGPTEVSITTHKRPYLLEQPRQDKSIGFPIGNCTAYILNENLERLPQGCVGELYLGGVGVARGYINREALSAERFVANPYIQDCAHQPTHNERIYKTGDLARWLPNGEVEYLGRTDTQVKIRGLRIELAEIEAALTQCPGVKQAVVIARNRQLSNCSTPHKYLVGFYLSEQNLSAQAVTEFLRTKLPEFMVPNQVKRIEYVPVTPSGKLDVKRLPETAFLTHGETYVAPSNAIEHNLCNIWSEVLGLSADKIGVHDSFFALGGDSILATQLAYTISERLGKNLNVANVFNANTIAMQYKWLSQSSENDQEIITKLPNAYNPVSLAQERLLFIEKFENGTSAYNIGIHMALPHTINQPALCKALHAIIMRHGMLRTLIKGELDGIQLQRTIPKIQAVDLIKIRQHEFSTRQEMDCALTKEEKHIFSLDQELPIRITLAKNNEDKATCFLTIVVHHACFDGWSWLVLQRDLTVLYHQYCHPNSSVSLPNLTLNYAEFSAWQRETLQGEKLAQLNNYWMDKLTSYQPLQLMNDVQRPAHFDFQGKAVDFSIDKQLTDNLRDLAKKLDISFYSVLTGAYCLMLSHYTNQREIVIGMPFSNRDRNEFKDMVGFFANLLVLKVDVNPALSLSDYLKSVSQEIISSQQHQEMPFEQLVKNLGIENDASQHPIVQVIFAVNMLDSSFELEGALKDTLPMQPYNPNMDGDIAAKFDLSGWISQSDSGLSGNFTYAKSLFTKQTVTNFTTHFCMMLNHIADSAMEQDKIVAQIPTVSDQDKAHILAINSVEALTTEPRDVSLHKLFEEAAIRQPNKVALVYEDTQLSFSEVDALSNQLAHYFCDTLNVKKGALVALMLDKSEWTVICILAVLKAGAAYVPLDPTYPQQRIDLILEDTTPSVLLTNMRYLNQLSEHNVVGTTIAIDSDSVANHISQMPTTSCGVKVIGDDLAYIIYTSGTSGTPKGVKIAHANVVSLQSDLAQRYFTPESDQTALLLANYVFDFSVEQLLVSIFSGHKLIIYSADQSLEAFYQHVNQHKLTFLSGTPTHIQQFDLSRMKHLDTLVVAGEAFSENHYRHIRKHYQGTLINAYGVTETTVYNTIKVFNGNDPYQNSIGKPLSNTQAYVLNDRLQLLPEGAVGELFLAGNCVGQGYLNRPELNESRFIANPLCDEDPIPNKRYQTLYRTGDLVRFLPNGELSYLGRNDQQIKLRGLRVELGEVESAMATYPDIKQCTVKCEQRADQGAFLVGYFFTDNEDTSERDIAEHLKTKLPEYMVPQQFIKLSSQLPMTVNGKIDHSALPKARPQSQDLEVTPARNDIETTLITILTDILGSDDIGIDHDFFKIGGDSISAMTLVSFIQREFNQYVRVKDIFDYPTVRALYDNVLKHKKLLTDCKAEQGILNGDLPLLPIQQWFFSKQLHNRNVWNQSFCVRTPDLIMPKLQHAIQELVNYHDAFRLRFSQHNDKWQQYYDGQQTQVPLHHLDVSGMSQETINAKLEEWQSQFDIHNGDTYCFAYIHGFEDGHAAIWFAAHHLIIDTVSWRILINDLQRLYDGGALGQKGSSYRQWVNTVKQHTIDSEENTYWASVVDAMSTLPVQNAQNDTHNQLSFELDTKRSKSLLAECHTTYDTQINDLLLSALGMALTRVNGNQNHFVTLEAHGREVIDQQIDISSTMGWFTTMYPFEISNKAEIKASVLAVKDTRRAIPNHGIGFGARYGYTDTRMPDISFNYLGRFSQSNENKGLWSIDRTMCHNLRDPRDHNSSDCMTDITVMCQDDVFYITIDSKLDTEWLQQFTTAYQDTLKEIVDHTLEQPTHKTHVETSEEPKPTRGRFDPYVEFNQSNTDGPILFVLPPGEGGAESYFNNLAKHLTEYRLVVFNNFYLHSQLPDITFEDLAHFYLEYVQSIQPQGPYHFLGWSFGGVLSTEMSRQLVEAGERIGSLHCIDSYFNVRAACQAQGLGEEQAVIDIVNYRYSPSRQSMDNLVEAAEQIVLFKAMTMNDGYDNDKQRLLYEYYQKSKWNNLETMLDIENVDLIPLHGENHVSWVNNQKLLSQMTEIINSNVLEDIEL